MTSRLTSKQKWQLAIKLLLMYSPLLFYLNMPEKGPDKKLINFLSFFILLSAIGLGMYFVWITATDSLQRYLLSGLG